MVAAACMVLYGYDASVYNSVQGSANWLAYFNHPENNTQLIGGVNTAYTVGAIVAGWFLGGPIVRLCFILNVKTRKRMDLC